MPSSPSVAVIGGGITGIASADVLKQRGFEVVIFEKHERLGGVWARAYPGVSLQNSYPQYHLSSHPWPSPPDLHPTGAQILSYLEAAVEARGLDLRLGTEVVSVRPEGAGWRVVTRQGTPTVEAVYDHVLVSAGQYTEGKLRPSYPGEAEFRGQILTERDVRDVSVFDGQRVVVLGFGKSALDMAALAVERGATVHHVFREPRWLLPRYVGPVHLTWLLFNRVNSVMMPSWTHPTAPERALHRYGGLVVRGFWFGIQTLVGTLARGAARGAEQRARVEMVLPKHSLIPDFRSASALAPDRYYAEVAAGRIQPHQGEIAAFTAEGVRLSDGTTLAVDQVVLSVGSATPTFPFLPPEHRALLEGEPDGAQLYRHLVHPRIPGLGFAGYNHGFMHVPGVEAGALWLSALWKGELTLPPTDEMEAAVAHIRAWKRAHVRYEPSRGVAVSTRFQQYLDILLMDLGLSPYRKLPNPIAELFARYGASDYAGLVQEYQRKPRAGSRRPLPLPT